jgi:hypothetical protein
MIDSLKKYFLTLAPVVMCERFVPVWVKGHPDVSRLRFVPLTVWLKGGLMKTGYPRLDYFIYLIKLVPQKFSFPSLCFLTLSRCQDSRVLMKGDSLGGVVSWGTDWT